MPSASPRSSPGAGESIEGTPDTTLTAFSPEDVRRASTASSTSGVTLGASREDPFVTSQTRTTLSAKASSFTPASTAVVKDIAPAYITVNPPSSTQFGTFTTDTGASRCLKVTSIYDADVLRLVNATLEVSSSPSFIQLFCF